MRLADVLENAGIETLTGSQNPGDTEITGITLNSQNVEPGSLFIAIRGKVADGHAYAASAAEKGAAALVVEEISEEIRGLGIPVAENSRLKDRGFHSRLQFPRPPFPLNESLWV